VSFDSEVVKPGRGRSILIDVSTDGFATVPYRWGDKSGTFDGATSARQNRLISISPIKRALGRNRIAASSTCTIEIDNADGAIDALCGRGAMASVAAARFRIYVVIWDPVAGYADGTSDNKLLGEFSLMQWPVQNNSTVTFSLADDFMSRLGSGLQLPTLRDWIGIGTSSNNPFFRAVGYPSSISIDTPIQLAFGEDWLLAFPHLIPWQNNAFATTYYNKVIVPLYSTTDLSAVSQSLIDDFGVITEEVEFTLPDPALPPVPRRVQMVNRRSSYDAATNTNVQYITVEKSPTITKGGIDFQVVYLVCSREPLSVAVSALLEQYKYAGDYQQYAVDTAGPEYIRFAPIQRWFFRGNPLSQRTNPPTEFGSSHPIDVLTDLVSEYSAATIDATTAARIRAGTPNARCAGAVQPWYETDDGPLPRSLRQEITKLAQSSDIDVFIDWGGDVAFSADIWDLTTATQAAALLEVQETELISIERWIPSDGERFAPFNRVNFNGGRASLLDNTGGQDLPPFQGPFDVSNADIALNVRVVEVVVEQGWNTYLDQRKLDPLAWRNLDGSARDRVKFRTHIGGLRLELGAYFKLTWTRGPSLGSPYSSTIFQCEGITYSPMDDIVEIEAIWRDDTQTERQYLLDNETLLVRSKGVGSGNANTDGTNLVEFDGTINLTTMGVAVGDVLILRDSTQAADVFTRNAAFRITSVNAGLGQVEVNDPAGAASIPAGTVSNADWSIVRGATTYPTAISDPSNYPSGGAIYGKVTKADGTYSDATVGNRLITG
jgi:hypothetical protein